MFNEITAGCDHLYSVALHVRSLLGPPWHEAEFEEALEFVLWRGSRIFLKCLSRRNITCNLRRHRDIGADGHESGLANWEAELPLVWLHPVIASVDRRKTLNAVLCRLEGDHRYGAATRHSCPVILPDQSRPCISTLLSRFASRVSRAIEATESAFTAASHCEALRDAILAAYRQACRDRGSQKLPAQDLMQFRKWVDGIVEAVTDLY